MIRVGGVVVALVFAAACHCLAQHVQEQPEEIIRRISVSGGLGVGYVSSPDVVNLVNASTVGVERQSEFKAGPEFFAALGIPITADWTLKVEYAYLLLSFNPSVPLLGATEYSVEVHMPTVIGQYTLIEGGVYNVRFGPGLGYHFGSLIEHYPNLDDGYTGKGLGAVLDLEANTAFGENVYGYFGGNLRWDFIGALTNGVGRTARLASMTSDPTLQFFSVGARLGFTYYF